MKLFTFSDYWQPAGLFAWLLFWYGLIVGMLLYGGCTTAPRAAATPTPPIATATSCTDTQLEILIPQGSARQLEIDGTLVWWDAGPGTYVHPAECVWLPLTWGPHTYRLTGGGFQPIVGSFVTICPVTIVGCR